jgi:AGCS family alanine or glycine:cation symporter
MKSFQKVFLFITLFTFTTTFAYAEETAPVEETTEAVTEETAKEEEKEEEGIDKKIDKVFGQYTGWFVKTIFYQIPIGTVEADMEINLLEPGEGYVVEEKNDTLFVSGIEVEKRGAEELSIDNEKAIVSGGDFKIAKSDVPAGGKLMINAQATHTKLFWVLIVLILGAVFFTIYFGFVNIRRFGTSINIVRGKYDSIEEGGHVESSDTFPGSTEDEIDDNPKTARIEGDHGEGEVSHFQALTAALSATVGLGNIAGVAIALSIGGPGATFWMIVAGLLGMSSKFVECTLGVMYREIDENGTVYGGPMYYLSKGLKQLNKGGLGKVLAVLFAIMCIGGSFGGGNMFQSNQAFQMFQNVTGGEDSFINGYGFVFGIIMAILVGIVIIGGIKSIAKVTDKIVPFMVGIYVLAALVILGMNAGQIPAAFGEIFSGAFTGAGITGGVVGVLIQGFKRAAFSNEAGIGSASIAHSAVKTKHPASEGLVALLEPFIDTVLVCTMTALVIVITNMNGDIMMYGTEIKEGVQATSNAFASQISWFPYVLAVAVILFAFSSMVSWSYYGFQAWSYLFGRSKTTEYSYKFLFCVFTVIGAAASLGSVIDFSDAMIFAMMVPNIIGLVLLSPKVREELAKYMKTIRGIK